ncbi:hypothetical protein O6A27_06200 [Escherichia coli]|nr:hypothetical protein [Escherichia coli]
MNFGEAERALRRRGHAFHPAPKSHEPFNRREAERYLPDAAPHFPLRWFPRWIKRKSLVKVCILTLAAG